MSETYKYLYTEKQEATKITNPKIFSWNKDKC